MPTRTSGGRKPSANPMPPLAAAEFDALTESIRERGVICPVVKDQTGFVLDGNNRVAIADDLGVTYPETVYQCRADQREILRIELNGARRQIAADEWKPLVDHLRSQATGNGARKYSDRVIARAVGVERTKVVRYKSTSSAGGAVAPPATKTVGEDGKVQNTNKEWSANDRVLHLISLSTTGVTAADLYNDPVLQEFSHSTIARIPLRLRDQGLIEEIGKRDRFTVWRAVSPRVETPASPSEASQKRKVAKIVDDLNDRETRDAVKAALVDRKGNRQAEAALRALEKEYEQARLADEKRQADAEKEQLRLANIAREQAALSVKGWDTLIEEVHTAWKIIAAYSQVIDDLPALHPSYGRRLDRELIELQRQLDWLDNRLHRRQKPIDDNVIDL